MKFLLLFTCCVLSRTCIVQAQVNRKGYVRDNGNRCLDFWNADTTNGTPIGANECNGSSSNQQWLIIDRDNTFRALGKCMATGGASNVFIFDCNGSDNQQWISTDAGEIVNIEFNRCLESVPTSVFKVSTLRTDICSGNVNQKWKLP